MKPFEDTVEKGEKGENAGNQHFLLSPTMFFYPIKDKSHHLSRLILSSSNAFNLVTSKILSFGEGLKVDYIQNFVSIYREQIFLHLMI